MRFLQKTPYSKMVKTKTNKRQEKLKIRLSQEMNESLKDLVIDYLIKFPSIPRSFILDELNKNAYFIKREGDR